jgi:hypothetical protein
MQERMMSGASATLEPREAYGISRSYASAGGGFSADPPNHPPPAIPTSLPEARRTPARWIDLSESPQTARFINGIHGSGDVSIVNDHVDELDLPDALTMRS